MFFFSSEIGPNEEADRADTRRSTKRGLQACKRQAWPHTFMTMDLEALI